MAGNVYITGDAFCDGEPVSLVFEFFGFFICLGWKIISEVMNNDKFNCKKEGIEIMNKKTLYQTYPLVAEPFSYF